MGLNTWKLKLGVGSKHGRGADISNIQNIDTKCTCLKVAMVKHYESN